MSDTVFNVFTIMKNIFNILILHVKFLYIYVNFVSIPRYLTYLHMFFFHLCNLSNLMNKLVFPMSPPVVSLLHAWLVIFQVKMCQPAGMHRFYISIYGYFNLGPVSIYLNCLTCLFTHSVDHSKFIYLMIITWTPRVIFSFIFIHVYSCILQDNLMYLIGLVCWCS